jgi:hypothetical protein
MAANAATDRLPYYAARGRDGAVVSVFGPGPAVLGAPFMEGLEKGSIITDAELQTRARHAAALAVALAATLLAGALCARTRPTRAAGLALAAALSFAGVPTLGQGLWQQTVSIVPLMAAVATWAWASWRGGAALALTPGLLAMTALARPNGLFLVLAVATCWALAVHAHPRRLVLIAVGFPLALLMALPQLVWNASHFGDPLALHAYIESHTGGGAVLRLDPAALAVGALGLIASPARGLFFYAPALLVALFAGLRGGDRDARILSVGIVLHVAVVAAYRQWWGGWVFGPRMLADAVWLGPLAVVALLPSSRGLRGALLAAGLVTVAIGLLGTFRYDGSVWDLRRDPDAHHDALWDIVDSPMAAMVLRSRVAIVDAPPGPYVYCGEPALQTVFRRPAP